MKSLSVIGLSLLAASGCAGLFDVDELPAEFDAGLVPDAGDDADGGGDPCAMPDCLPEAGCADTPCLEEVFADQTLCAACEAVTPIECEDFGQAVCSQIKQAADDATKPFKLTAPTSAKWGMGCGCCDTGLPEGGAPLAIRAGKNAKLIVSYAFPPGDGPKLVALRLEWIAGGIDKLLVSPSGGPSTSPLCGLTLPDPEGCDRALSLLVHFDGTTDPATHDSCDVGADIGRLDFGIVGNGEAFARLRGLAVVQWAE